MRRNNYISPLLVIALVLPLLFSCGGSGSSSAVEAFTDTVYTPQYATGFTLTRCPGKQSVLLSVSNAWQGCDSVASRLLILQGDESAPEGFDGEVIHGPAHRIVTMSSTNIAMLDAVGETSRVVGVSGMQYITNPSVKTRSASVPDVGFEGSIDYETIVALDPDLVMIYGVDGKSAMAAKLRELKIPYVYIGDYMEQHPLGKAEWIVPVAAIAGKMESGKEFFRSVARNYEDICARVDSAALTRRPKVLVNAPYSGSWFMPTPESFSGRLVTDAGGSLLYDPAFEGVAVPVETEAAYRLASQADIWINPGQVNSLAELRSIAPKYTGVPPLARGNVWNNNLHSTPAGGNDYFESGVIHPDWILADLVRIFNPGILPQAPMHYYQKLN